MNILKYCYLTLLERTPLRRFRSTRYSPDAASFVTVLSLTREELRVLGAYWMELYLDNESWCVNTPADSPAEQMLSDYAASRLALVEGLLGRLAFADIEHEAQSRLLEGLEKDTGYDGDEPVEF